MLENYTLIPTREPGSFAKAFEFFRLGQDFPAHKVSRIRPCFAHDLDQTAFLELIIKV